MTGAMTGHWNSQVDLAGGVYVVTGATGHRPGDVVLMRSGLMTPWPEESNGDSHPA